MLISQALQNIWSLRVPGVNFRLASQVIDKREDPIREDC